MTSEEYLKLSEEIQRLKEWMCEQELLMRRWDPKRIKVEQMVSDALAPSLSVVNDRLVGIIGTDDGEPMVFGPLPWEE